ncbi:hypothetical protein HZA56_15725 [Candidatus Poribacteria bacterium]|nr:hypothetical protein [Candidatus Poribacteria bacterium]
MLCLVILAAVLTAPAHAAPAVPKVGPSVKPLDLSRPPAIEDLIAAGQLGGPLYPTHEMGDKQKEQEVNLSFGEAIQEWNKHEYKKATKLFKKHIEQYPDSPWASEAVLHMGCDAQYNGRYSEAEESFEWILVQNKGKDYEGARILRNKATLRLGVLKVYQNNFGRAQELFRDLKMQSSDWRDRTYASHWIQRLSRYTANERAMLTCGTQALAYVLEKEGRENDARDLLELKPETLQGQSIRDLSDIASKYGHEFAAIRIPPSDAAAGHSTLWHKKLPLPAIVHISGRNEGNSGHYWILEKVEGEDLNLFDPQSGRRFSQSPEEFSREWSGIALVFSDRVDLPGIALNETEMEEIYGGCCGVPIGEGNLGNPGRNAAPTGLIGCPMGAPAWSVNMVNMNLFVTDTPLWYNSPIGPPMQLTLSYNSQSSIAQNEPFGNKWQLNYGSYLVVDTAGQVTVFMPDGKRDVYSPDGAGGYTRPYQVFNTLSKIAENHFELRFPDDTVYTYNIPAGTTSLQPFLTQISDAHGQTLTIGYDANVHLTTVTDAMNRQMTLTYNAAGLVTQATLAGDPLGRSALFEYDANRNLTKITDMGGYWSSFTYDEDVYLASIGNERGTRTFYVEPSDGTPFSSDIYPPPGEFMYYNYRITVTDPLGGKEEYYYSGAGYAWYVSPKHYIEWESYAINNFIIHTPKTMYSFAFIGTGTSRQTEISRVLYPDGGHIDYGYDTVTGDRTSIKDVHGHTWSVAYNSMDGITSITDARGKTTTITYYPNDVDLLEITNGLGTISLTYNSAHDITSITDRLGNTTSFAYNTYGQIETQTNTIDLRNIVTQYVYSPAHYLDQVTRGNQTLAGLTYDSTGRVETYTDATALTLAFAYNNLNNVTTVTWPDARFESYAYSDCCPHMLDSLTDRAGRTANYTYDPLKRLTEITGPGGTVKLVYDANGNLLELIDPNSDATTYEYDVDDRPVKMTYADDASLSVSYDGAGLLAQYTNARGTTIDYTYDQNHNLLGIDYSDTTPDVTYEYDDYNRPTRRTDGVGTYQYAYDANSRVTSVDGPWADDTLTYHYDDLGRRDLLEQQGGQTIGYDYDDFNRLTGIQVGQNTYSYGYTGANPLVQAMSRPNGSITTYQYDTLKRLTAISNLYSTNPLDIINKFVYAYGDATHPDLRSSETITNGNPITSFQNELITYNYNNVNQLLSSTNPSQAFTYDDDGNMTQGYTPEGYVFSAQYDAENRLKTLTYTGSGGAVHRTEYSYSGDSLLANTKKYENDVLVSESRPVLDGFLPLQERDGANSVVREYAWGLNFGGGIGGLLDLKQGGQNYSYLYDGKGEVTALLNGSEEVVAAYTYDAFGNLMSGIGTLSQPFKFSTKPYDQETGLSYFGYRFYSPVVRRWITRDPIGYAGGMNLYAYVGNGPVNWIDPLGLTPQDRVDWAENQYNNHKDDWKGRWYGKKNRCNEFVAAAHIEGDPDAKDYPDDVHPEIGYDYPLVEDLADVYFEATKLDNFAIEDAQPGDIIVWYKEGGSHHSALHIGNGLVIYQHADFGLKKNTIEGTTSALGFKGEPIARRYVYTDSDKYPVP